MRWRSPNPQRRPFGGERKVWRSGFRANNRRPLVREAPPLPTPDEFYTSILDGLKEYENGWAWALCPLHGDQNPSLAVNLKTGGFKCHSASCEASGSNIVSFVMRLKGLDFHAARSFLQERQWI